MVKPKSNENDAQLLISSATDKYPFGNNWKRAVACGIVFWNGTEYEYTPEAKAYLLWIEKQDRDTLGKA